MFNNPYGKHNNIIIVHIYYLFGSKYSKNCNINEAT